MRYYELNKEEKKLLEDFEKGVFVRVPGKNAGVRRYQNAAKSTLNRVRTINLRVSERDLQKMKARAAERGIPYQTLATSVLHEYAAR